MTPEELANLAHLRRARDLIDHEYACPLDGEPLARAALMSTAHVSRQFRAMAMYGATPYAYLMTRRIERAMALLRRGDPSVTEVCLAGRVHVARLVQRPLRRAGGRDADAYRARDYGTWRGVPGSIAKGPHPPGPQSRAGSEKRPGR